MKRWLGSMAGLVLSAAAVGAAESADSAIATVAERERAFDIVEKGKEPVRDGLARFTTLWRLSDGAWRMSRVLSYDHGPAAR